MLLRNGSYRMNVLLLDLLKHHNSFQAIFFNFRAEGANFLCNFRREAA